MAKAKKTNKTTTLDALYNAVIDAHRRYVEDSAPIALFLIAFKKFRSAAKIERRARFASASRYFDEFAQKAAALETDEDADGVWRSWSEGVETVARYDRSIQASQTPPSRSINELIALGVPRQQIAKIYGFKRADGSPDVDAVERRDEWRAPTLPEDSPIEDDAAEIARLAVDALERFDAGDGETIDDETIERLRTIVDEAAQGVDQSADDEPSAEEIGARIDREILDGVPVRQIAARYGIATEDVKARADVLGIVAASAASELPPRIVKQIEARREEIASGQATFADVAASVSASDRRVTVDDVKRVLGVE